MKLDIKRTIYVGLAFLTIGMFWELYDTLMPLYLDKFNFSYFKSGVIMALDNIFALLLLPLFGRISDKTKSKWGRRIPFIFVGTVIAAFLILLVNLSYNLYINETLSYAPALTMLLAATCVLLVAMCVYRTPAVSLMPDVTPKPLRSKANAIINIMGTVGGALTLVLTMLAKNIGDKVVDGQKIPVDWQSGWETPNVFVKELQGNNWFLVSMVAGLMLLALVVFIFKVNEIRFVEDKERQLKESGYIEDENESDEKDTEVKSKRKFEGLSKPQIKSLFFLLIAAFFWYMAYNGVKSHFTRFYVEKIGGDDYAMPILIAMVAAFIMYVPASVIGSKIGRKNTVILGIIIMFAGMALAALSVISKNETVMGIAMYICFILVGAGWATINVHSYIMSVEMSKKDNVGFFTGLYYTFTMAAQIITPILAGALIEVKTAGMYLLFPYAAICLVAAFVLMMFVNHGNAKEPIGKNGLEMLDVDDGN